MMNPTADEHDDDRPADAAEMLRISREQELKVSEFFDQPTMYLSICWGIAWLVGFLTLWSATDQNPWFQTPELPAGIVFGALIVSGIVISIVLGARTGQGVSGPANWQGAVYGWSWALGCTAVAALGAALAINGLDELAALFYPAGYSLVVGLLYLSGAALWRDRGMLVVGVWMIVVGVGAPFFGAPTNYLIMAFAGGGAFLAYGIVTMLASRRRRRRVTGGRS